MKIPFPVSLDEELAEWIKSKMKNSEFRNRSHLVEEALNRFKKTFDQDPLELSEDNNSELFSREWILRTIMRLNDEEIGEIKEQRDGEALEGDVGGKGGPGGGVSLPGGGSAAIEPEEESLDSGLFS